MVISQLYRLRRQGAETLSGCEVLGRRDPRGGAADLPEQSVQGLAGLGRQRFEPTEVGRLHVTEFASHLNDRLDLRKRAPGSIQEAPVLSGATSSVPLRDVQRDAITGAP